MNIKEILRHDPNGMTIDEIKHGLQSDFANLQRYLDILVSLGDIEAKMVGSELVYYLPQRIPISALFNYSSALIIMVNSTMDVVEANDNFIALLNIDRRAILGKPLHYLSLITLAKPDLLPKIQEAIDGEECKTQISVRIVNRELLFNTTLIPTTFDDGSHGMTILMEDITAQKRIEQKLRESEEKFRAIVKQSAENIFIIDVDTKKIMDSNATFQSLLGYTAKELKDLTVYDFVAHSKEDIDNNIREILKTGSKFLGHRHYQRKDGAIVDVEVGVSYITYAGKSALSVVSRDITERSRMDMALQDSEAHNRALLRAIPDLMFSFHKDGKFLEYIPAKNDKLALPPSEFLNKNVYEVLPTALAGQVMKHIEAALSTGEVQKFEYHLPVPYPSGPLHNFEARLVAIDEEHVLAIIRQTAGGVPLNEREA